MEIKNNAELRVFLEKIAIEAINEVSDNILKELQIRILRDVYRVGGTTPTSATINDWYYNDTKKPTYEFYRAWDWDAIKKTGNTLVRELYMHRDKLGYDQANWKHGSPLSGDVRDALDDILNLAWNGYKEGYTSSLRRWGLSSGRMMSKRRKPYWENLIKELYDKKKLEKWVEKAIIKRIGKSSKLKIISSKPTVHS